MKLSELKKALAAIPDEAAGSVNVYVRDKKMPETYDVVDVNTVLAENHLIIVMDVKPGQYHWTPAPYPQK